MGTTWKYCVSRLPSQSLQNPHIVQVTSAAVQKEIIVNVMTNLDEYSANTTLSSPIIVYANVMLDNAPIVNAKVFCQIQYMNQSGALQHQQQPLQLADTGNGDPDTERQDGIYSKYLTWLPGPGRYTISLHVTSEEDDQAFVYAFSDGSNMTAYTKKLGHFKRIVKGHSFRIDGTIKTASDALPPARILDLSVDVLTSSQQLEFHWTAPGDDYDEGKPSSYQLFESKDSDNFYRMNKSSAVLVESFSGVHQAGGEGQPHHLHCLDFFRRDLQ